MRLLLDTHIFLWMVNGNLRVGTRERELIANAKEVYVSSATLWEIAIKFSVGKLRVDMNALLEEIATGGFRQLPVMNRHAMAVAQLPLHHRDPFDRMLVAQAMTEPMRLLTSDAQLKAYSELVIAF
ncbi:MAG TPA: type II toxin-antitoxin system VapC family toxin [Terracidiphilus sp.]|nr:type II toxin-antitoxin system VapC family toxin [Terracidiphilus sp.]